MIVHARDRKTCDDTAFGVYVDGKEKGKHIKVCTNSKCAVHGYAAAQAHGSAQDKEKRAKAKVEALTRMCIFQAIFQASSQFQLQDEDYLKVVEFAIWRAGHNGLMRTAKVVGWNCNLNHKIAVIAALCFPKFGVQPLTSLFCIREP
ncbi:MAG: hypothetical protein J2P13_07235 [Acidobacteria bacterium]|nr:hypothetical protein [Acidobacteriota bacterium]